MVRPREPAGSVRYGGPGMIVKEPPYDLVALFSDLEMQRFFEELIERGQARGRNCMHEIRWRSLRDPRRDTVWSQPELVLLPFLRLGCCYLIVWDHHGTGLESQSSSAVEAQVVQRMATAGAPSERVLAVSLEPELESLFKEVWPKVKAVLGEERSISPPEDSVVLAEAQRFSPWSLGEKNLDRLLKESPKETFEALVRLVRLRRSAPLYEKIGAKVSLPALKRNTAASRIASAVSAWFPRSQSD